MIDHIGIKVRDYAQAKVFYTQALAPLGYAIQMELTRAETGGYEGAGFGVARKPFFWISADAAGGVSAHVAFTAANRAAVDAFYAAALAAGGRDNGAPGLRAHYHPNYYGAFVFDPDGNNIEAVCHTPS